MLISTQSREPEPSARYLASRNQYPISIDFQTTWLYKILSNISGKSSSFNLNRGKRGLEMAYDHPETPLLLTHGERGFALSESQKRAR
jgi:hypothetical protein